MAASQGYQCQFQDSVPEELYCKQCSLVARKLTITSCCGESYCNACILSVQQAKKPCPECGEESFETYPHAKSQKKILSLEAFCPLKEKGCGWCGKLDQLDAHLDPDEGDCEYADLPCPLNCHQKVARKDITHHTADECIKRDYICPYCSFKAIYEIVADIHWPECSYYPLPCPNRCGVTCERPTMEDHMKICPLQEVECEFQHVGCEAKFRREEEEEHMREKSQAHLTMMVSVSYKINQQMQRKIQEQEERLKEQEKKFTEQLQEHTKKLEEQHSKEQNRLLREQEQMLVIKFQGLLDRRLQELVTELEGNKKRIDFLEKHCICGNSVTMTDFSKEKAKNLDSQWKSPAMYTHVHGYKFCIGIDANGYDQSLGRGVRVELWAIKGEHDDQLKWPANAKVTIDLINYFPLGKNKEVTAYLTWERVEEERAKYVGAFEGDAVIEECYIKHSELRENITTKTHYLVNDTLNFKITDIFVV